LIRNPAFAGFKGFVAAWLGVIAIAALACDAAPSPRPSGPMGRIDIAVAVADPDNPLFEPVYRARAVSQDGTVDTAWRLQADAPPTGVPAGHYRLEAFTAFLSDTIVCTDANGNGGDPGSTPVPGGSCFQPTLDPGQVCTLEIDVPSDGVVHLVYQDDGRGGCRLTPGDAPPT